MLVWRRHFRTPLCQISAPIEGHQALESHDTYAGRLIKRCWQGQKAQPFLDEPILKVEGCRPLLKRTHIHVKYKNTSTSHAHAHAHAHAITRAALRCTVSPAQVALHQMPRCLKYILYRTYSMPSPGPPREASSRCLIGYTTDKEDGSDRRGDHEAHRIPTCDAPVHM